MWHEVEERILGLGIVTVDNRMTKVTFGIETIQKWRLHRFHSVTPMYNDESHLAGFQFYENGDGKRRMSSSRGKRSSSLAVSCAGLLKKLNAKPGHYPIRKERDGFLTVNFALRRE